MSHTSSVANGSSLHGHRRPWMTRPDILLIDWLSRHLIVYHLERASMRGWIERDVVGRVPWEALERDSVQVPV
jgi:hypothetical protein